MRFTTAVAQLPVLSGRAQAGLGALNKAERAAIEPKDAKRLRGSIDLDAALRGTFPNANRWDYAIAFQHANRSEGDEDVYWIEFHSAHDHGATEVLRKVLWLKDWLAEAGRPLAFRDRRAFIWVASGGITMTKSSPRARSLAAEGVAFPRRRLELPDRRTQGNPLCGS